MGLLKIKSEELFRIIAEDILTKAQAAKILGISEKLLSRYLKEGIIETRQKRIKDNLLGWIHWHEHTGLSGDELCAHMDDHNKALDEAIRKSDEGIKVMRAERDKQRYEAEKWFRRAIKLGFMDDVPGKLFHHVDYKRPYYGCWVTAKEHSWIHHKKMVCPEPTDYRPEVFRRWKIWDEETRRKEATIALRKLGALGFGIWTKTG
jgi:hypothetical protein